MAWYVIQSERKTWIKYIVEAADEGAALESRDDAEYLGYVDGDETESALVGGPFENEMEALDDIVSYVEG